MACRTRRPQAELIRFTRTHSGRVVLDAGHRLGGRGGYTCRGVACIERAHSRGLLARTLRISISREEARRLSAEAKEYLLVTDG